MKKIKQVIMVLILSLTFSMTAWAAQDANEAVNEDRNGVLQINLLYIDQAGNKYLIQGGSGFLIGETTGADHMITNAHVITMDDETKKRAGEAFGVDFFNANNINLQIQVVVKRDVVINATVVNSSETMDFAILKLEQPIYDRAPLTINSDAAVVLPTDVVYALGFPSAIEIAQDATYYTSEDVNITDGIVSKFTSIDGVKYIQHSCVLSAGNSGGPLINRDGEVIGLNRASIADTYFYSVHISEITSILDALGINYTSSSSVQPSQEQTQEQSQEPESESVEVPSVQVDKSALSSAAAAASNLDVTKYSQESVLALADAVAGANAVINDALATQADVTAALTTLENAQLSLVEKSGFPTVAVLVAVIVVIVLLAAVILAVSLTGKKKKAQVQQVPKSTIPRPQPQEQEVYRNQSFATTGMASEGAGETSVLNSGAGETGVLGGGNMQIKASLTRYKNNESFSIAKQNFKIGKERSKVDYCIPDNTSISRQHASIICKNGSFYLVDLGSTNFTYVNGNKVTPNVEVKLNSGDRIKFADEEFEFRC